MASQRLKNLLGMTALLLSLDLMGARELSTRDGWRVTHAPDTLTRITAPGALHGWLQFRTPKWRGPQSQWPAFECRFPPQDWSAYDRLAIPLLCDSSSGSHLFAVYVTDGKGKLQRGAHAELRLKHPQARLFVLNLKEEFRKKRLDPTKIALLHIYTENPPADQRLLLGPPVLLTPQEKLPLLPDHILRLAKQRRIQLLQPLLEDMTDRLNAQRLDFATASQQRFWTQRKHDFLRKLHQGQFSDFLLTHGTAIPDYQSLLSLAKVFNHAGSRLPSPYVHVVMGLASSASKVLPRVPVFQPLPEHLSLDAARNEHESLQLVVMPLGSSLSKVRLSFTAFRDGRNTLPASSLHAIPVGFVETTFNPPNGSPHIGFWPDPLLTFLDQVPVAAGEAQPFWIKAAIPSHQPAGTYRGTVDIHLDGTRVRSLPLTITVRNFTLPNHSLLPLSVTFGPTVRKHSHRMEKPTHHWRKHMGQWHEMLADYYLSFDHLYWNAPDMAYFPYWKASQKQGKAVAFNLGNFHVATDKPQNDYGLQDVIRHITPVYRKAKELGLLRHAYIYGADEAQKETFDRLERSARILRKHFPEVSIATTAADQTYGTESPAGSITRFCPLISTYNLSMARKARRQGRQVWWYISNTITPPYPNIFVESDAIEIRLLMGAMAHKYQVDGFLYYYMSFWNTDTPITTGPYTGMNARSYPRYNGDGNWCYQGPDNTPIPTLRLENFRDGLEDYAYLQILHQRLMMAMRRNLVPAWQHQARQALAIDPELVADRTHYTRSPERLLAWKKRLARLIETAPALDCPQLTLDDILIQRKQRLIAMEQKLYHPITVQEPTGYNSWPMIQALGNTLVCAYSKGTAHTIADGQRGAYARFSTDGGKTWSPEQLVVNTPEWGNVPIGKGLDSQGNLLLWVRSWGPDPHHDLFRSRDGIGFEKIASLTPDPMPMQITDIIQVPTVGLMALWFTGDYSQGGRNAWGTLTSSDDGKTWSQHVMERDLERQDWPTEPSAVYLGNGRLLAIARTECKEGAPGTAQFQLESSDYGKTWTRAKTNITDVAYSTPSLILNPAQGTVTNYYYVRGTGEIKRRVARIQQVLGQPRNWPEPELLGLASDSFWDAGNANATVSGNRHVISFYAGDSTHTAVQILVVPAP